ncbi:MAG: ribonuclease P [Methanofollis sp.]|nr:ribonuclease P [Methanofollis sp.]
MRRRSKDQNAKKIAHERIALLFERAAEFYPADPELSNRCVALARRIAMRQRVRIPKEFGTRFCRRCSAYLVPGSNARVRVQHGKVIVTCRVCGRQKRYPVVKEHRKK